MNVSYTIISLVRNDDGSVTVTLLENGGAGRAVVTLPNGSPAIAALTIGRQVNATFTAV